MYLRHLSINGFKSFAKASELRFEATVTAIVGPNGSGKSNVAEAFRFVLGEQSVKSMRGKRGEDLIWGGTEQVSRGNRASVQLVLDNSTRTFALDFDEVKIERTVFRDGQNEYKLNGSVVRLKDIQELLAAVNIGPTGHHIISQGEADRVLSATPKERAAMIEDALGLKVFQLKKQEAERKLEKTRENMAQVEALRREAAPHLRYLSKQLERVEQSRRVQAELRSAYLAYLKREDVYVAHHQERVAGALREAREQLREREQAHKEATRQASAAVPDDGAFVPLREAVAVARAELHAKEQAAQQLAGQIALLERRLKPTPAAPPRALLPRGEVQTLTERVVEIAEKALSNGTEKVLVRALQDVQQVVHVFWQKSEATTIDVAAADTAELAELQTEWTRAEAAVEAARRAVSAAADALAAAEGERQTQTVAQHAAEMAVVKLENALAEQRRAVLLLEQETQLLERDRHDFKNELQEAVALLGRAAAEYFTYELVADDGTPVSETDILAEARTVQRDRQRALERLKIRLEELGVGNTEALEREYADAAERDAFLARELADLEQSAVTLEALITELQAKIHAQFTTGIASINKEFATFFTLMFGGGTASLSIVERKARGDEGDGEGEVGVGVELAVKLPNKRVSGLEMLSGGERTLTSIALIFAMSQVNPPPFIIFDETDAALDEANSRRYGDMIEALAKKSQLVLITHNRETMSRAGVLYGITMGMDGVSKLLSVKLDEAVAVAK